MANKNQNTEDKKQISFFASIEPLLIKTIGRTKK